jgi:hypothetical protein
MAILLNKGACGVGWAAAGSCEIRGAMIIAMVSGGRILRAFDEPDNNVRKSAKGHAYCHCPGRFTLAISHHARRASATSQIAAQFQPAK